MANMTLLRLAGNTALSKTLGASASSRLLPGGAGFVQKKSLMLSPVAQKRIYGPDTSGPSQTGHWKQERVISAALVPLVPAAILFPCIPLDLALSSTMMIHTHWGLAAVLTDYIHGETLPKLFHPSLLVLSIMAFGGLCYLDYNDVGLGNAVRMLFTQL